MESAQEFYALKAALDWQVDLGVDEAIQDVPVNRFETVEISASKPAAQNAAKTAPDQANHGSVEQIDPVAVARHAARAAETLEQLHSALQSFEHCELKRGARNCVFADGTADARVMIIGEAPGRDEDIQGKPFVGRAGQLLDKMLRAIGLDRMGDTPQNAVYITNVLPWRPPQNRDPLPAEIAMLRPFVLRHIELARPELVVLMGNIACQALLDKKGITRLRGTWTNVEGIPTLPMFHPAYLLRNPERKREAWADLLDIQARLEKQT